MGILQQYGEDENKKHWSVRFPNLTCSQKMISDESKER